MPSTYFVALIGLVAAALAGAFISCAAGRRLLEWSSPPTVWALAGIAAVGGVLASGAPTGVQTCDLTLRAGFALCVVLLASKARRWAWVLAAGVAVVGSYDEAWLVLALFALGLGVGSILADSQASGTVLGAMVGACASQVLLRLSWSPTLGVSAALAALALLVVAFGGAHHTLRPTYRWLGRGTLGIGALVLVATALAGVEVLRARAPAEAGLADAEAGLSAVQSPQPGSAVADLEASTRKLREASRIMTPWWAKPAEVIPVVSQNERAVAGLTAEGADVTDAAAALVQSSASSNVHDIRGAIDLPALSALGPSTQASLVAVQRAQRALTKLRSPWLLPVLSTRISEFGTKVNQLATADTDLVNAIKVLPDLLGKQGPQRYLIMVQDPSELRGGGLIVDQAILTADKGRLSLSNFTGTKQPATNAHLDVDPATEQWAVSEGFDVEKYTQDDAFSPDFPTDAALFEQSNLQLGTPPVAGVISVDPAVLKAVLEVTGPVSVPGWPVALSSANVERILLHDQYVELHGSARMVFLADAAGTIFHVFTQDSSLNPLTLARALAAPVRSKQLMVYSNNQSVERNLGALGIAGAIPAVKGDFLEVVTQNAVTDKIDWFLRRSLNYQARYNPTTRVVSATLTITLTNGAPASGEPQYVIGGPDAQGSRLAPGTSAEVVTVYTPLTLAGTAQSGRLALLSSVREKDRYAYSGLVKIGPGASATIVLHLTGTLSGAASYQLEIADQPAVAADDVRVTVDPSQGWKVASRQGTLDAALGTVWRGLIDSNKQISVTFAR